MTEKQNKADQRTKSTRTETVPDASTSPNAQSAHLLSDRLNATTLLQLQRTVGNQATIAYLQPIQRLMSLETFRTETTLFGEELFNRTRTKIVAVENQFTAYEALGSATRANIAAKQVAMDALLLACNTYLGADKAERKSGVRKLKLQCQQEKTILDMLTESEAAATLAERFEKLSTAQDRQTKLRASGVLTADVAHMDPWMMACLGDLRNDPPQMQQVLQNEITQLESIRDDPNTPPVLQRILAEVLANKDNVTVKAAVGSPMANYADPNDHTQGYDVYHNLNAPLGAAERLGSLTHELTHVAVSVTFQNTSLFLAFQAGATDQEILTLSNKRSQQLAALEALMEADSLFTAEQKMLMRNKIQYPYKGPNGNIKRYIPRFLGELGQQRHDALMALADRGLNNTVIEFDTVINQLVMYMHMWGIPQGNAFYRRVRAVADEAATYRGAAH